MTQYEELYADVRNALRLNITEEDPKLRLAALEKRRAEQLEDLSDVSEETMHVMNAIGLEICDLKLKLREE